ncbi:MAG: RsmD family RNA methyltransferase [Planctomycetaceae bacterium]|nr:RsmD family RNA methyltransferase [Planctomycetaceae bacterium]
MRRTEKKQTKDTETTVFDIAKPDKSKPNTHRQGMPNRPVQRNVGSEPAEKEPLGLRIIGGKFRGSKLQYTGDNRVRPMKDRVREAVFNLIGPAVKGMHTIDLFGGTGAMAIESISRGATSATIIELHLPTASLLKKNLEALDLLPICNLCKTDAFFWVKNDAEHPATALPWLIFCSPPYEFYFSRREEMLAMLHHLYEVAPAESIFVIEADERFDLTLLPRMPEAKRIRFYPPAVIAIFNRDTAEM